MISGPKFRRITLPPIGNGKPVLLVPPFTQIQNLVQAQRLVEELSFVNQ